MESQEDIEKALALNGKELKGKAITVTKSNKAKHQVTTISKSS